MQYVKSKKEDKRGRSQLITMNQEFLMIWYPADCFIFIASFGIMYLPGCRSSDICSASEIPAETNCDAFPGFSELACHKSEDFWKFLVNFWASRADYSDQAIFIPYED